MQEIDLIKLRNRVGIIPSWIRGFPGLKKISGLPLRDRFLLSPALYADFMSENPGHYVVGLVIHELEHLKRMKEKGFVWYHILYRINSRFRYQEELACHYPQFKYYKENGYSFDLKSRAKILSGSLYLWCVTYEKALTDLEYLWNSA